MTVPDRLQFRPLAQDDVVRSLSLGSVQFTPLKKFLAKESKELHFAHLARTLGRRTGNFTRVCLRNIGLRKRRSRTTGRANRIDGYRHDDYPAVKLARLAVDQSLRKRGVGAELLRILIAQAVESVMPVCGCRFMVVDAKPESVEFYRKREFQSIGQVDGKTLMYLDLLTLPP